MIYFQQHLIIGRREVHDIGRVRIVAVVNPHVGDWAAYESEVLPGESEADSLSRTMSEGDKLAEDTAVALFPQLAKLLYRP